MKYSFKSISAVTFAFCLGFSSCSDKPEPKDKSDQTKSVASDELVIPQSNVLKPIPARYQDMVKADKFTMDVSKGFSGTTRKGMKINIPSDALVDENNQQVKGNVDVEVVEYYSPAEIIVSNIPMQYMDGDELKHFQSDGMFKIKASQNGKELKVAEDKKLTLTTKRSKEGEGFEFYGLEENKWVKNTSNQIESLTTSNDKLPVLKKPNKPFAYDLVKFNSNYYTVEKDERVSLPKHNANQQYESFYDKNTVKQLNIDVTQNPWVLDKSKWHFVKRTNYILKKNNPKQTDFDTVEYRVVHAIRGNKKYEQLVAKQKKEQENYETDLVAYNENYKARVAAGQVTVSEKTQELVVDQFGTYNIDRFYHQSPRMIVKKSFDISIPKLDPSDRKFLIVKESNGQLIPIEIWGNNAQLQFSKAEKNVIIAMSEDKVYAINQQNFTGLAKAQIKNPKFDFQLKEELTFSTTEEFNELLNNLF